MPAMDAWADSLYDALPASTYEEIAAKMSEALGRRVNVTIVAMTLHYVRGNAEDLGWTVPYTKHGPAVEGDEERFFALDLERDPNFVMDEEHQRHVNNGSHNTIQTIATHAENLVVMLAACVLHERLRVRKDFLNDLQDDLGYVARKSRRMANQFNDKAA